MNMFRNFFTMLLTALGLGLWFGQPDTWQWPTATGPYIAPYLVEFLTFAAAARPWSILVCAALVLTLIMTRLKY